jgi:hypothetical protein
LLNSSRVGDGQRERTAVLELERDIRADELGGFGHVAQGETALDAMQAWDRQPRHRHALKAAYAIWNPPDRAIAKT